jgi:hypothetical protein
MTMKMHEAERRVREKPLARSQEIGAKSQDAPPTRERPGADCFGDGAHEPKMRTSTLVTAIAVCFDTIFLQTHSASLSLRASTALGFEFGSSSRISLRKGEDRAKNLS